MTKAEFTNKVADFAEWCEKNKDEIDGMGFTIYLTAHNGDDYNLVVQGQSSHIADLFLESFFEAPALATIAKAAVMAFEEKTSPRTKTNHYKS